MKIFFLISIFLTILTNVFSQKVSIIDYAANSYYEIDVPDTVYVVTGKKIEQGDFYYIDYEDFLGKDLFFLDEPRPSEVWISEWEEWSNRVDIGYMREVFFGDYYTQDFELESSLELYRIYKFELSKYSQSIPLFKKVTVIPYNSYGKKVSEKAFFEIKNSFETVLKILMKSAEKKKD